MSKRDLSQVTTDLARLAEVQPLQKAVVSTEREPPQTKPAPVSRKPKSVAVARDIEKEVQLSFSLRPELRRKLKALAIEADIPERSFILLALKKQGLPVTDHDLIDLRKHRAGEGN